MPVRGQMLGSLAEVTSDLEASRLEYRRRQQAARQAAQTDLFGIRAKDQNIEPIETRTGTLYTADPKLKAAFRARMDEGPTEEMLRDALGYSEVKNNSHSSVVRVLNPEGRIVHEETTSEANEPIVRKKLEQRYANRPGYIVAEKVPLSEVVKIRSLISDEEGAAATETETVESGSDIVDPEKKSGLDHGEATITQGAESYLLDEDKEIRSWKASGRASETNKQRFLDSLWNEETGEGNPRLRDRWEVNEDGRSRTNDGSDEIDPKTNKATLKTLPSIPTRVDTLSDTVINRYFETLETYAGGVYISDRVLRDEDGQPKLVIALSATPSGPTTFTESARRKSILAKAVTRAVQLAYEGKRRGIFNLPGWELHDIDPDGKSRVRAVDPHHLVHAGKSLLGNELDRSRPFAEQLIVSAIEVVSELENVNSFLTYNGEFFTLRQDLVESSESIVLNAPIVMYGGPKTIAQLQEQSRQGRPSFTANAAQEMEKILLTTPGSIYYDEDIAFVASRSKGALKYLSRAEQQELAAAERDLVKLEKALAQEEDSERQANLKAEIRELRPKVRERAQLKAEPFKDAAQRLQDVKLASPKYIELKTRLMMEAGIEPAIKETNTYSEEQLNAFSMREELEDRVSKADKELKRRPLLKIISGGQIGADVLGLKVAKSLGFETGGTAPRRFETQTSVSDKSRLSRPELGTEFGLIESESGDYRVRTEENVINSDGTLILNKSEEPGPGSKVTVSFAINNKKPYLVLTQDLGEITPEAVQDFIIDNNIQTLNIAGSRNLDVAAEQTLTEALRLPALKEKPTAQQITKAKKDLVTGRAALEEYTTHLESLLVEEGERFISGPSLEAVSETTAQGTRRVLEGRGAGTANPFISQAAYEGLILRPGADLHQGAYSFLDDPVDGYTAELGKELNADAWAFELKRTDDYTYARASMAPDTTREVPRYNVQLVAPAPTTPIDIPPGITYTKAAAEALSMGDTKGNFLQDLKRVIDKNFGLSRKIRILLTEELDGPRATERPYFTIKEGSTFLAEDGTEIGNPNDYIRAKAAEMNSGNNPGKIISIGDYDIILLNPPRQEDGSISNTDITEAVLAVAHELGHGLFRQEIKRLIANKGMWTRINNAFQKARGAKDSPGQYQGDFGFEEWYADNIALWLIQEGRKSINGVESHFKKVADKLRRFFKDIRSSLQKRFLRKIDPDFNKYVTAVVASYKGGLNPEETPLTTMNKVVIRNMADALNEQTGRVIGKRNMRKLNALSKKILSEVQNLLPSDKKHWASSWLVAPTDNYLRRMGPIGLEIARIFYSRSQSEEAMGFLNRRTLVINRYHTSLLKIMAAKDPRNPTTEEKAAFQKALFEAEKEATSTESLSPQAKKIREWLQRFYVSYVAPNNPHIKYRANYFSRHFNIAGIQNEESIKTQIFNVLKAYNPSISDGYIQNSIDKMISNLEVDDDLQSVSDFSIGMAAARVKLFRHIPNEAFRRGVDSDGNINPEGSSDTGILTDPEYAVQKYVENMVKRVEYNASARTVIGAGDLAALLDDKGKRRRGFELVKSGQEVRGWRAMEVLINRIEDPIDRQGARDAVMAMLGRTGLGMKNPMRNLNSGLLFLNIVTYLTFAVLASLPDLAGPILRSKNFSALPEAARQLKHYFNNPAEAEAFANEIGVISRDSINTMYINAVDMNYMTQGFRKASDTFFRWTFTEAFTKFSRTFAAGMGEAFLLKHAKGRTELDNRYLRELGAGVSANPRADILAWAKTNRNFDTPEGARVRDMLGRFVDESIIRPNAAERPVWASNPYTALIWQLKSFFYAYGKNIIGGQIREMKNRYAETGQIHMAAVPLILGAVTLLPLTMIGLELREGIKWAIAGGDETKLRTNNMGHWEYTREIVDRAGYLGPYTLLLPLIGGPTYGGSAWLQLGGPSIERVGDMISGTARKTDYMPFYASMR